MVPSTWLLRMIRPLRSVSRNYYLTWVIMKVSKRRSHTWVCHRLRCHIKCSSQELDSLHKTWYNMNVHANIWFRLFCSLYFPHLSSSTCLIFILFLFFVYNAIVITGRKDTSSRRRLRLLITSSHCFSPCLASFYKLYTSRSHLLIGSLFFSARPFGWRTDDSTKYDSTIICSSLFSTAFLAVFLWPQEWTYLTFIPTRLL